MSTAVATTEAIKSSFKYTYDHAKLPPLAMAGALPEVEAFSSRPEFVHLIARSALTILVNTIMIGVKGKEGDTGSVQPVLESVQAVARQLGGKAARALNDAMAMELGKQGAPTTPRR